MSIPQEKDCRQQPVSASGADDPDPESMLPFMRRTRDNIKRTLDK
jgi:hypothetical protein